jgi:hypothetical protein
MQAGHQMLLCHRQLQVRLLRQWPTVQMRRQQRVRMHGRLRMQMLQHRIQERGLRMRQRRTATGKGPCAIAKARCSEQAVNSLKNSTQ